MQVRRDEDEFTLYCADCRMMAEEFDELSGGGYIIVTDPPFNIGYHYNTYRDRVDADEYRELMDFATFNRPSVIIHYPEALYQIAQWRDEIPRRVVAWTYPSNTPRQHRDIAFFGVEPDFTKVRQPYKNPNDKRIKERIARGITGGKLYDWWQVNQVKNTSREKTGHPCQMPLEVMERIIGILPEDATIVDPFMGSGTTGVAVAIMNTKQGAHRRFIGIEMDEAYYEIAKQRIEESWK